MVGYRGNVTVVGGKKWEPPEPTLTMLATEDLMTLLWQRIAILASAAAESRQLEPVVSILKFGNYPIGDDSGNRFNGL